MGGKMDELIAYCGLVCQGCPIYRATREKNEEKRAKMRAEIIGQLKRGYETVLKPKDVTDCDGCRMEGGRLFSGCSKCQIRKCAREKGVENCAHCNEYVCEKLEKFFAVSAEARKRLDEIKNGL
jgi:hypothetical protein